MQKGDNKMIPRYTRPEMEKIWNERNEWQTMLDVEIAACEANAELGRIPKEAVEVIKAKANFDVDRIHEIDKEINHDIIAFLSAVAEYVGDEAKYIHMGLTSTDVKDTGLNVQVKQASDVILKDLEKLAEVLKRRAVEFKYVPTIGRTHGVHAEPTTFGLKLLLWYSETLRNIERMKRAAENMCVGKLSGAVGTYADIDPYVEEYVCKKLGLKVESVATQVVQRSSPGRCPRWRWKCATCSARKCGKRKNISARNRKAPLPCPTNGTRCAASASAAWPGWCRAMCCRLLKIFPCGTSGTSPTPLWNG